jgi:hypothetical protein
MTKMKMETTKVKMTRKKLKVSKMNRRTMMIWAMKMLEIQQI